MQALIARSHCFSVLFWIWLSNQGFYIWKIRFHNIMHEFFCIFMIYLLFYSRRSLKFLERCCAEAIVRSLYGDMQALDPFTSFLAIICYISNLENLSLRFVFMCLCL